MGSLTALVKLAGAAKVIVSGRLFGAGDALDACFIAFLIPSFLADAFAGSLYAALLPVLVESRQKNGPAGEILVYAKALYSSLVLFLLAAVLLLAGAQPILRIVASGFPASKLALSRGLLVAFLPILPLSAVNVIWRSLLNAHGKFIAAAAAPVLTPVVTIALLLFAGLRMGVFAIAAGTSAGVMIETLLLAIALYRSGLPIFPRPSWELGVNRQFLGQYFSIVLSNLVMGGSTLVDQTMAATLGVGSVSAMNLGTRLTGAILAVGPTALNTAVFPRLSLITARREWPALRQTLRNYVAYSAVVTIPITAVLISFSGPLVKLLFQRGAFTSADTHIVTAVQACSLLQVPFSVILALLLGVVASLKMNHVLLRLSLVILTANVIFNYLLMKPLGVAGIALSTVVVHVIACAMLASVVFQGMGKAVQLVDSDACKAAAVSE